MSKETVRFEKVGRDTEEYKYWNIRYVVTGLKGGSPLYLRYGSNKWWLFFRAHNDRNRDRIAVCGVHGFCSIKSIKEHLESNGYEVQL
jgi:hypothetical protein